MQQTKTILRITCNQFFKVFIVLEALDGYCEQIRTRPTFDRTYYVSLYIKNNAKKSTHN